VVPYPCVSAKLGAAVEIESMDVRVLSLQNLLRRGAWRVETPHSSERARLYWITKGQGRITACGVKRGFGQHTAIYLPPRTMYSFEFPSHVYGSRLCFPIDLSGQLPEEALYLRITDSRHQAELTQVLDQVANEVRDHNQGWYAAARSYSALVAVQLVRFENAYGRQIRPIGSAQRIVEGYTGLIEEHLSEGLTVADYAQKLGITPTHLTRVCREVCGKTASNLLHERVINEARRLLEDTDQPVRNIARDLGFGSAAYFTRAFGQRIGITPSAARRIGQQRRHTGRAA
jgi:AraC family transcriptional regulator, transcriptional activator of pobA